MKHVVVAQVVVGQPGRAGGQRDDGVQAVGGERAVQGLPVGLSFIGPRWSEPRLIALAYAFEQAAGARLTPALRATCPPPGADGLRGPQR